MRTFLLNALCLAFMSYGANAQTPTDDSKLPKYEVRNGFLKPVDETEKFPAQPTDPLKPEPMVLEYRLGTHVEAMARKWGWLSGFSSVCNVEGVSFDESALGDMVGEYLDSASLPILKNAYQRGAMTKKFPPCDQSQKFIARTSDQIERHQSVIAELREEIDTLKESGEKKR